ncbi:hypothetical protein BKN38_09235 [Helicobacter sp. CLO-3]|uniref:YiiX/YebB-like N1pC/P60 family cysteine hydrolase n=1 Tax=unclassified Helicobacter TaxID=2593540 RepID=UPI0008054FF5|nr:MULTISPECIES: YiiX/YebB-like N1pC/P60 family cysteine hydrolase [unclassified Helicobacter]OBV28685.1 hypothetical protein BA723_08505 [Helicobacter sp. CLO-3]OHU81355.1 hypothetical protein BKN38_09235 [Helicobacter sp. CLO-3]
MSAYQKIARFFSSKSLATKVCIGLCALVFFIFILLAFGASKPADTTSANPDQLPIFSTSQAIEILSNNAESGDIIFRQGLNTESVIIAYLSDSLFSHIGMVISTNPFLIIHATTDDDPRFPNQVIISPLQEFLAQGKVFALSRQRLAKSVREAIAADSRAYLHRAFVLDTSESRLYCTSFLESIIVKRTPISLPYARVSMPVVAGEYLFPQAFFESDDFEKIVPPFALEK